MAIDTRSGTSAGGAGERSRRTTETPRQPGRCRMREPRTPIGRLMPEMTASSNTTREGDVRFEAEALPFIDDVYRFALSLTRDAADADDVVQETFLRAYRSWHTFQPGSDARRWLFTITRNVFLRARERERRHVEFEDGDLEALNTFAAHGDAVRDGSDQILSRIDLAAGASPCDRRAGRAIQVGGTARRSGGPVVRSSVSDPRRAHWNRSLSTFPGPTNSPGQTHHLRARRRVHDRAARPTRTEG